MDFCNQCHNMLYVKTKETEEDKKLEYFCRTCNTIVSDKEVRTTVYQRNYTSDNNEYKLTNNEYILNDPSLPRMNNIECINSNCLTHHANSIQGELVIKPTDENLVQYLEDVFGDTVYNYQLTGNVLQVTVEETDQDRNDYLDLFVNNLDYGIEFKTKKVVEKPQNEVVFIKYDSKNMKFMYICAICKTSWKNKA